MRRYLSLFGLVAGCGMLLAFTGCSDDDSGNGACGDGVIGATEECDGDDLAGPPVSRSVTREGSWLVIPTPASTTPLGATRPQSVATASWKAARAATARTSTEPPARVKASPAAIWPAIQTVSSIRRAAREEACVGMEALKGTKTATGAFSVG